MATIGDAIRSAIPGRQRSIDRPLSLEDASFVIDNQRRRLVVDILDESESPRVTLGKLAEAIASTECEKPPAQLDGDERKRVYVALYQTHLDKLDEIDVVAFDKDRATVSRGPAFDHGQRVLEAVREECESNGGGT